MVNRAQNCSNKRVKREEKKKKVNVKRKQKRGADRVFTVTRTIIISSFVLAPLEYSYIYIVDSPLFSRVRAVDAPGECDCTLGHAARPVRLNGSFPTVSEDFSK